MDVIQNPFVRKLRQGGHRLSTEDEDLLSGFFSRPRAAGAARDLVLEGDERTSLLLIVNGWACHYKQLANGARQIISLLLPGDLCQPFGMFPQRLFENGLRQPLRHDSSLGCGPERAVAGWLDLSSVRSATRRI
jgi:CRP-like cAMP-binding protein